ncbi:ester cyclase [Kribbella sp. NPDC049174]|uniref:ester cyclase n=1 Tax=Kribbella sp. NPDC049174 TaxID=3364112 RepID=UPI00371A7250
MSTEENKTILRDSYEAIFNQHEVDRAGEFYAPDYLDHDGLPGQAPGLDGAKQKWAGYFAGAPDLRRTIEEMIAEGDKVAVAWTVEGTHEAELLGISATGKPFRLSGMSIYRLAEGKITEQREWWDRLALMRQLGVLPNPDGN